LFGVFRFGLFRFGLIRAWAEHDGAARLEPADLLDEPVAAGRHGQARPPDLEGAVRTFHGVSSAS
jgi:hypothetical protein